MFPIDCKRYPDYETDAKFQKIGNNRIAYLSDIRTDRGTEFIGHLDFLSAKPTKPTLFNNSALEEYIFRNWESGPVFIKLLNLSVP